MQKDSLQRGLPIPDEASARQHCLREGLNAPDPATVKDFLRFHIATSRGKIVEKPKADSVDQEGHVSHELILHKKPLLEEFLMERER
jgi:hypothetical protein